MAFLPFSAEAKLWEPIAEDLRELVPCDARKATSFDPWLLAPIVGLRVLECNYHGLSVEEVNYMTGLNGRHWSGGVYPIPLRDGSRLCLLNPAQPFARQKVTLMEEVTHCYLGHAATKIVCVGDEYIRAFDSVQEREAFGVAAAVLLPWKALFPLLNSGTNYEELSRMFEVTKELIEYRVKICGASLLYRKRQKLS